MEDYNYFLTSNGFMVKNIDLFKEELEKMDGVNFFEILDEKIYVRSYKGVCSYAYDEEIHKDIEYPYDKFMYLIQRHIKDDEKVFVSSIGNEKLKYLIAECTIITKDNIIDKSFFDDIAREYNLNRDIF